MKEQPTPDTNPEEYFSDFESKSNPEQGKNDEQAKKEAYFFSGDLSDADVFLKIERFKLQKENEDSERKLREKNAKKAYKFSRNWAIFIAFLIIIYGFFPRDIFKLSEVEFMFVIGSLTASILTFYLLVIKYLFYIKPEKKDIQQ